MNESVGVPIVIVAGSEDHASAVDKALRDAGIREAPALTVIPPVLTAVGCIILFFYAGAVQSFLSGMVN